MASDNYSFRLNSDRKREAEARLILHQWREKGYTVREILTEALLNLDRSKGSETEATMNEMKAMINTLSEIVDRLQTGEFAMPAQPERGPQLPSDLVKSLQANRKPGRKR
jgi:hypothetical protein